MLERTRAFCLRQHRLHLACITESLAEQRRYAKSLDKKRAFKLCFARRFWGWWILLVAVVAMSVLLSIYHDKAVNAIRPWADKIRQTQGAWAVPVAALIVLSIPPLAGAEIIILAVGVIWGLAWGFLITIIGTWMGEILCFYLFKYFFREKAQRIEKSSNMYRQLAEVMRRDGLWMVSVVRFSAIPGHITTAIQSCIGISIWVYGLAAAISLPKQLALVYLGVLFGQSKDTPDGQPETAEAIASKRKHTIVTWLVLCITGWLTFMVLYVIYFRIWLYRKQELAKIEEGNAAAGAPGSEQMVRMDSVATSNSGNESKPSILLNNQPSLEYFTTQTSGNRTPAPSYRELMPDVNARTKASNASLGQIYKSGQMQRSRSSTAASLAFSNNSLPYLPYTPMLDVPSQSPAAKMPSPVPSAAMPSTPKLDKDSDIEIQSQTSASPKSFHSAYFSSTGEDTEMRTRRGVLVRSSSDFILPTSDIGDAAQGTISAAGYTRSRPPSGGRAISPLPASPSTPSVAQMDGDTKPSTKHPLESVTDQQDNKTGE